MTTFQPHVGTATIGGQLLAAHLFMLPRTAQAIRERWPAVREAFAPYGVPEGLARRIGTIPEADEDVRAFQRRVAAFARSTLDSAIARFAELAPRVEAIKLHRINLAALPQHGRLGTISPNSADLLIDAAEAAVTTRGETGHLRTAALAGEHRIDLIARDVLNFLTHGGASLPISFVSLALECGISDLNPGAYTPSDVRQYIPYHERIRATAQRLIEHALMLYTSEDPTWSNLESRGVTPYLIGVMLDNGLVSDAFVDAMTNTVITEQVRREQRTNHPSRMTSAARGLRL